VGDEPEPGAVAQVDCRDSGSAAAGAEDEWRAANYICWAFYDADTGGRAKFSD